MSNEFSPGVGQYTRNDGDIYRDDVLVLTVWKASERPPEGRKKGESWLDMRRRTEPYREEWERQRIELAEKVLRFLNGE